MSAPTSNGLAPIGDGDHVFGAEEPRLTLVEYGDFGCPHCFAAKLPIESLLRRFDGLSLVWRHLPDPGLNRGPTSPPSSQNSLRRTEGSGRLTRCYWPAAS